MLFHWLMFKLLMLYEAQIIMLIVPTYIYILLFQFGFVEYTVNNVPIYN